MFFCFQSLVSVLDWSGDLKRWAPALPSATQIGGPSGPLHPSWLPVR